MKAIVCLTLGCLLSVATLGASAQDLASVQARMKERIAKLAPLKTQKVVGENNAGFVEVLQADANATAKPLVEAENADRKVVYTAIAAKTGADPAQVGRQRAKELADRAAPGLMLQREDGTWYEKR